MNTNIDMVSSIVFWDPAFDAREYGLGFEKEGDIFLFDGKDGRNIQVSQEIVQQRSEDHIAMLQSFPIDVSQMSVIFA